MIINWMNVMKTKSNIAKKLVFTDWSLNWIISIGKWANRNRINV